MSARTRADAPRRAAASCGLLRVRATSGRYAKVSPRACIPANCGLFFCPCLRSMAAAAVAKPAATPWGAQENEVGEANLKIFINNRKQHGTERGHAASTVGMRPCVVSSARLHCPS